MKACQILVVEDDSEIGELIVEAFSMGLDCDVKLITNGSSALEWLRKSQLHRMYEATPARHSSGMVLKESDFAKEFHALKHRQEDLCRACFTGVRVDDGHSGAGVVDEQLLAGAMHFSVKASVADSRMKKPGRINQFTGKSMPKKLFRQVEHRFR